jgi:hypothetical protein
MLRACLKNALFMLLACALALTSCATVTLTDVGNLRIGMTVEEVKSTLPIPPKYDFPVEMADKTMQIQVLVYLLHSGDYASNYLLAFKNDQLFYWGYPHEFARSKESLINEIGEKAVVMSAKLDKEHKEKIGFK